MRTFSCLLGACLIVLLGTVNALRADDKVIVHEWGTFTCLQDEQGHAIGGINVDDEPVPNFVYGSQSGHVVALNAGFANFGLPPYGAYASKGAPVPACDPSVTMRLETPVLYIYPSKGKAITSLPPLDVQVWFHGGYLSQYYPYAETGIAMLYSWMGGPGKSPPEWFKMEATTTSLNWKDVRLGSKKKPVETTDKVWTTPREVSAPLLEVKAQIYDNGGGHEGTQAEHFLFYRGVGHLDSPVQVELNGTGVVNDEHALVEVHPRSVDTFVDYSEAWLVDIREDGKCAYVAYDLAAGKPCKSHWKPSFVHSIGCDLPFEKDEYSAKNLADVRTSMHHSLMKDGLYDDEATAMLKTWELSYFKSPGLRFFYIVPRKWVDTVLPLKITGAPTEITRVMVGRIELITGAQKAALARLAAGPCPDLAAIKNAAFDTLNKGKLSDAEKQSFYTGEKPLTELGITIPPLVQDYLSLGRFRDALIGHEQQQHPSAALAQFIKDNRLASGN